MGPPNTLGLIGLKHTRFESGPDGVFYTPNMYAYNLSFNGQQYNYSAAVAIVMGVITAVIAYVVQLRGSRKGM